ncbi:MAG: response regulator [bacterium]|nr:response regulator [bacterium]
MKALIVDDDPDAIAILGNHLQVLGCDVHASENPREAVAFYERLMPDLVFMDIDMSFPGGFIATQNIRHAAKKLGHKVTVIMYTASKDPEDVQKAKNFGANDYLLKPVTREGVQEKLRRHFPDFA